MFWEREAIDGKNCQCAYLDNSVYGWRRIRVERVGLKYRLFYDFVCFNGTFYNHELEGSFWTQYYAMSSAKDLQLPELAERLTEVMDWRKVVNEKDRPDFTKGQKRKVVWQQAYNKGFLELIKGFNSDYYIALDFDLTKSPFRNDGEFSGEYLPKKLAKAKIDTVRSHNQATAGTKLYGN